MYFSDAYNIESTGRQDWFDPILQTDTKLFVDPFQIFKDDSPAWRDAHDELIAYFQSGFDDLARAQGLTHGLRYERVVRQMTFPEPKEFGLGYVGKGSDGAGTGRGLAVRIVEAMQSAIDRQLEDMRHFEELGILVGRIGRDRISDITCNILKPRFIAYTQTVCRELAVPVQPLEVPSSVYDEGRRRWEAGMHDLPVNPVTGRAVILIPKRYLRELPALDANNWWDFAEDGLRDDLNLHIMERVDAVEIARLAREHPDLIREYVSKTEEETPARAYDVERDPEGIYLWDRWARESVRANTLSLKLSFGKKKSKNEAAALDHAISEVVKWFKHFVEHAGGWRLLWHEDLSRPRREESIQLLFKGVVQYQLDANGVRLDREVELGKGPVDFIFSKSHQDRVLMEVKKIGHSRFWDGLEGQLISYMTSDKCSRGWFLAVRFRDNDKEKARSAALQQRVKAAAGATGFDLHGDWIDARVKVSASRIAGPGV